MDIWNLRWSISALAEVLGENDNTKSKKRNKSDDNDVADRRTPRFNVVKAEVFEEKRATKRAA